jgi:hypothetical protein
MSEHGEYSPPPPEKEAPPEHIEIGENVHALIDIGGIDIWAAAEDVDVSFRIDPNEALKLAEFIAMHHSNLEALRDNPQRIPLNTRDSHDSASSGGIPRLFVRRHDAGPEPIPINRDVIPQESTPGTDEAQNEPS